MEMLNRAAAKLSLSLYYKNYIDSEELEWCIYVIEKLILRIIFLTFTFTWVVLTASPVETLVSVSVVLLFEKQNRRISRKTCNCVLAAKLFACYIMQSSR